MGVRAPPPGSGASRAAEPLLRPQRCRGSAEVGCGAARGEPDSVYSRTHWAPRGNTQGLPPPGGGLPSTSSQAHSAQARVHLPPCAPAPARGRRDTARPAPSLPAPQLPRQPRTRPPLAPAGLLPSQRWRARGERSGASCHGLATQCQPQAEKLLQGELHSSGLRGTGATWPRS